MNKSIRYTLTTDQSGYGTAAVTTCNALIKAGYDISTNIITIAMSRVDASGNLEEIRKRNIPRNVKINICEQVPILWDYSFQKNTYNLGKIYWETSKLPKQWVDIINNGLCDEIWASCEWNKTAYIESGVKKPIYVIPPISNFQVLSKGVAQELLPLPNSNAYKFYCIAQYTKRKGIDELFQAYYDEFDANDNVMLVVKLYGTGNIVADKVGIKEQILKIRIRNKNPAPVYFIGELLQPIEISALHSLCDCYVSPHRGEGWSIPIAQSMANGKQIITTRLGGITDMLSDDSAYILPHSFEKVNGMPFRGIYDESMLWGKVEINDIKMMMRKAYNERNNCEHKAKYVDILNRCSEEKVLELINERLSKIN